MGKLDEVTAVRVPGTLPQWATHVVSYMRRGTYEEGGGWYNIPAASEEQARGILAGLVAVPSPQIALPVIAVLRVVDETPEERMEIAMQRARENREIERELRWAEGWPE